MLLCGYIMEGDALDPGEEDLHVGEAGVIGLEEIVARPAEQAVDLVIHWKGGKHTMLRVARNRLGRHRRCTDTAVVDVVRELARVQPDGPFDSLVNAQVLDDRQVVEVMARSLLERLQRLERAQRATRNPAQAERLMTASLKEMQALERALRRREELAKPRQELVGKSKEFVGRVFQATKDACAAFIEDYLQMMDDAVK